MTKPQRKEHDVVKGIIRILSRTKAIGIAVEPIATMNDPTDKVRGDYTIRACYFSNLDMVTAIDDTKRYCCIFEGSFVMSSMMHMDDARFNRNLIELRKQAEDFRDTDPEGHNVRVATHDDIMDMGKVVSKVRGPLQ